MSLQQEIKQLFPKEIITRHTLQELAGELWDEAELAKLLGVNNWKDILELDVANISDFGFGGIYQFMEADMLLAYLPALIFFTRAEPYPSASMVTNLVTLLDPDKKVPDVDESRIDYLKKHLTRDQKLFLADTFAYIAQRDFQKQSLLFERVQRLSSFWRNA